MKLHSIYLNPFQPFPERELGNQGEECPGRAIEDNMSRAVFSALANSERPDALAIFLQEFAQHASSPVLRDRTEALAAALRRTDPRKVEFHLQSWPTPAALQERAGRNVLLIGISSSHHNVWTHDQRPAPFEPRADAWIYVPGEMLLVFECKNDEHPLDATQVSAYTHKLRLFTGNDVPRAQPGLTLASPDEARAVQKACEGVVLDAPWHTVVDALKHIQGDTCIGGLGHSLSGQAAAYIQLHVRPPYRGIQTILDWLNIPDTPDRRDHLRTLVRKMGVALTTLVPGLQGAITFAQDLPGDREGRPGAGAAFYVRLSQDRQPLQLPWLGKMAPLVLWFQFNDDEKKRIGLEFYVQASGAQPDERKAADKILAWNLASDRHKCLAGEFEQKVAEWIPEAPAGSRVDVSTVCFNGRKRNWQGAGVEDPEGPKLPQAKPSDALTFLRENRDQLWRFPQVGPGATATIEKAARQVRKPALALVAPLDTSALAACGIDGMALQAALREAVASIDATTAPDSRLTRSRT